VDEHGSLDLAMGRDTQCVKTIIDALVDLPSPALKARLAATGSALAAAKSEREEAAKRLETAKAKHRDLLSSQVVYSRLAGARNIEPFEAATRNPPSGRADYVLVPAQRRFAPAGRRSGERTVSVRRSPLQEREMPLHRLNEGRDYDAAAIPLRDRILPSRHHVPSD
jgi:hypothetical protein